MKNFTFGTLEYVRPDVDAFEEKLKGFTERIKNAKSYAEVKAVILENDKVMSSLYTMLTVASIRNTLNTTDEFYEKEVAFTEAARRRAYGNSVYEGHTRLSVHKGT